MSFPTLKNLFRTPFQHIRCISLGLDFVNLTVESGLFYAKDLQLFVHLVVLTPTVTGYKEVRNFKLGVSNVSGTD